MDDDGNNGGQRAIAAMHNTAIVGTYFCNNNNIAGAIFPIKLLHTNYSSANFGFDVIYSYRAGRRLVIFR